MYRDSVIKVASVTVNYTVATMLFASLHVSAAGLPQNVNRIEPNTLNEASGFVGINVAAGDNNIQANNTSIALGKNAQTLNRSFMQTTTSADTGSANVSMGANTLTNARGLISVNQVAGSGNAQLNDIALAFGDNIQMLSDISLSIRPPATNNSNDNDDINNKTVYLDNNSLKGATGTIQLNQIAGNGNIAVNRVSMPIQ
ncbi:hypothetical protein GCM10011502_12670 [Oceanisphaera marina]|uniref:Adhesin n=1 Tax=Oceanisphaera marina TaxID=2017550 RepID=A0ABQ1IJ45_9GAMM|nr:hypothetical protein [Oceanisphaera marina]GGB40805.1 hypothetical protein GCM10011502_12670 [Oceanisphaera marina]